MAEFKVDIKGLDDLEDGLARLKKALKKPRPLMLALGLKAQEQVKRNFDLERDPVSGAAWDRHHPISGLAGADRLLRRSGGLFKSITSAKPRVRSNTVTIGSKKKYADIHQTGGVITPKGKFLAVPLTKQAAKMKGNHPARDWITKNGGIFNLKKNPRGKAVFLFGRNGPYGIARIVGRKPVEELDFGPVPLGGATRRRLKRTKRVTKIKTKQHWLLKKSVTIPARPYLGMNDAYETELGEVAEKILTGAIRGEGDGGINT